MFPFHPEWVEAVSPTDISLLIGANPDEMRLFRVMQGAAYALADERALLTEMHQAGVASLEGLLAASRFQRPIRRVHVCPAQYSLPSTRGGQLLVGGCAARRSTGYREVVSLFVRPAAGRRVVLGRGGWLARSGRLADGGR